MRPDAGDLDAHHDTDWALCARAGSRGLVLLFLVGAMGAAAAQVFTSDGQLPVLGSAGAVSAVVGAYLLLYPRARVTMAVPAVVVPVLFYLPALVVAVAWLVLQLPPIQQLLAVCDCEPVSYAGHAGGLAVGIGLGWLLVGRAPRQRTMSTVG